MRSKLTHVPRPHQRVSGRVREERLELEGPPSSEELRPLQSATAV